MNHMKCIVLVLALALCLTSCVGIHQTEDSSVYVSQTEDESSQTIDFENSNVSENSIPKRGTWVETEDKGNVKITREYRNYGDEITVTTDTFYDDGTLYQKIVINYKNNTVVSKQTKIINKDESYEITNENFDENGNMIDFTTELYSGKYIQKKHHTIVDSSSNTSELLTEVEYFSATGELVAKGNVSIETVNDTLCTIERLEVFQNGQFHHNQVSAISSTAHEYTLYEITNSNNEIVFSKENTNGTETICVFGNNGFIVVTSNEISKYTEDDGTFIAEVNGSNIVKIGDEFSKENIVAYLEERIDIILQHMGMIISLN